MSHIEITLPDGSKQSVAAGTRPIDIARGISPRLADAGLAAKVNGEMFDLTRPIEQDATIQILTARDPESLEVYRHSAAHLIVSFDEFSTNPRVRARSPRRRGVLRCGGGGALRRPRTSGRTHHVHRWPTRLRRQRPSGRRPAPRRSRDESHPRRRVTTRGGDLGLLSGRNARLRRLGYEGLDRERQPQRLYERRR